MNSTHRTGTNPDTAVINFTAYDAGLPSYSLSKPLRSIAQNGSRIVVGGGLESGPSMVSYSDDGATWTLVEPGAPTNFVSMAYGGNDTFAAVGKGGRILSSTNNAVTWSIRTAGSTTLSLLRVRHLNGLFVAVGNNQAIVTSSDGVSWSTRHTDADPNAYLSDVVYGNGVYVSSGSGGSVFYSSDGVTWTETFVGSGWIGSMAFGNGTFVIAGNGGTIATSTDGANWTIRASLTTNYIQDVVFMNGKFYAFHYGYVLSSSDGITWSNVLVAGESDYFITGIYANNLYFLVGWYGSYALSIDGENWVHRNDGLFATHESFDVIYNEANNIFVSVGKGPDAEVIVGNFT